MAPRNVPPLEVPLHRLLKRQEAAALLAEFGSLLPGGHLALIGADGRVYAGSAEWKRAELQRWQPQAGEGQSTCVGGVVFQPVFVQSRYVGALVARAEGDASPGPLVERTFLFIRRDDPLRARIDAETVPPRVADQRDVPRLRQLHRKRGR